MPVPWRIPVKYVTAFRGEVVRYAREADPSVNVKKTLRTWRWLPGWFERLLALPNQFVWPTQVGLAGAAMLMAFGCFVSSVRQNVRYLLILDSSASRLHRFLVFYGTGRSILRTRHVDFRRLSGAGIRRR